MNQSNRKNNATDIYRYINDNLVPSLNSVGIDTAKLTAHLNQLHAATNRNAPAYIIEALGSVCTELIKQLKDMKLDTTSSGRSQKRKFITVKKFSKRK